MKLAPINYVQLALMIIVVACPTIGGDWPKAAVVMQLVAATAAGSLSIVALYAPPPVPTTLLNPSGIQAVHILQGLIGFWVTTITGLGAAHPTWGPTVRIVSTVGGVLMGVFGMFAPKALNGPIMALRLRRASASASPTPKEGLPPTTNI